MSIISSFVTHILSQQDCFTLDVSIQYSIPEIDKSKETVFRLPKSRWYSISQPKVMQADPFLFVDNETLYIFYEELSTRHSYGIIKMVSTKDLKTFSNPVVVLEEYGCHFSYPYVFKDGNDIYMMPECGCTHSIRLYKASNNKLTKFELHKVLIQRPIKEREFIRFDFADSCVYKKEGIYYLFTSYNDGEKYFLELYFSENLNGSYKKHPQSPICIGNKYSRCGGCLIEDGMKLYRPAQDCEKEYGGQIHLLRIIELTPTRYLEEKYLDDVIPIKDSFYKNGGHQLNFVKFKGHIIIATDAKYQCSFFLERILLKIKKIFK